MQALQHTNKARWWIGGGLVALLLVVGAAALFGRPADTRTANRSGHGQSDHVITVGEMQRTYHLYVPESLPDGEVPLVVMLHGALGTGAQAESSYGWNEQAEQGKFVVAYPNGLNRSWAVSDGCCGPPAKQGIDDVGFIEAMVADIQKALPIADSRIYAAGISNGGALAYRLACDTDTFAAVGVVSATLLGECPNPQHLSVMHIHGLDDATFPYMGGPGRRHNDGQGDRPADTSGPAIPALMERWREANACSAPTVATDGAVTTTKATCPEGRDVVLLAIDGAGHQWPGGAEPRASKLLRLDPPSRALDATESLWRFFEPHHK